MASPKDGSSAVTMADLKSMESLMSLTMEAKFNELQNLILSLKPEKESLEKPALEDSQNSSGGDTEEDKEKKKRDEADKLKNSTSTSPAPKPEGEKADYHDVSHAYSLDPPIPHPRINPIGSPPPLDVSAFPSWQHSMKPHFNSASIELWMIFQDGFQAMDPSKLTRKELVEAQLNATAIHMLE